MIPITKAVLYRTGIGYFERKGTITSNVLKLNFRNRVMNDILASLTVITTNSQVTGVSYEGHDVDLSELLADALINLPPLESFKALLNQLIGCEVSFTVGSQTFEGVILGIQTFPWVKKTVVINQEFILMKTKDGSMKSIPLAEIKKFQILDDKMKDELEFFIEKIYEGKKKDSKTLTIHLDNIGDGDEITVSYLEAVPSWKCSYRLLLGESAADFMIQGWALIDNVQDEDWTAINLSLIAGLPISFVYDLYSPNWIQRPSVARKDRYDINVVTYEEDEKQLDFAKSIPTEHIQTLRAPTSGKARAGLMFDRSSDDFSPKDRMESVQVQATGAGAGDYFQYQIGVPVTVQRNQSSLVPILQTYVKGTKVSVYNEKARKANPMSCLELENISEYTFEEGPISVFEQDTYSGEAMLPFMRPKEKRLIPYSVDLGVNVTSKQKIKSEKIFSIKMARYSMLQYNYEVKESEYTVNNKTIDEERAVIMEHPILKDYELFDTEDPFEKTKNFYRYKFSLPPKKAHKLMIKVRRKIASRSYYNQVPRVYIEELVKLKLIGEEERDFLLGLVAVEEKKQENREKMQKLKAQRNLIAEDQERLRENIKSLGDSTLEKRLKERYITKLEKQEESLDAIELEIEQVEKEYKNLEKEYEKIIKKGKYPDV